MAHFHLSQIARILGKDAAQDVLITGFQQDNREIASGNLFFALKGEKVDGHAFLEDVYARGGRSAIVSKEYAGEHFGLALIKVDNVLSALHDLARYVHASRSTRVIAVTGSVGKTTTKEFIATLLEGQFKVAKTPGNANSQVGVPLSILNARGDEELFVIEMGMSQKGEIEKLISIAPPEISVVTNISYAHVVFFPEGIEGIARAKAEIFSSSQTRLGIASAQAAQFDSVLQTGSCPKIIYGPGDYVLQRGEEVRVIQRHKASPPLQLPFEASHLCENFLAAAAVAREMGMSWEGIASQTPKLSTLSKRFEKIVRQGITFINDSYNANVTSMRAALNNLPAPEVEKKRIAVLGAMKELGNYSEQFHREVAECALAVVDQLLCMGEECQVMVDLFAEHHKPAELHANIDSLQRRLFELAESGDVVLLKGSRSNQLWKVLEIRGDFE